MDVRSKAMTTYIGTVELGGLYRSGSAVPRPDKPWLIDLSVLKPFDGLTPGNIADFSEKPSWTNWVLGDTPAQEAQRLRWHVLRDGSQCVLICDRVILVKVSWQDLDQAGFVNGTVVQIDGRSWTCRLLTGGNLTRKDSDGYSRGVPANNEWDRYIVNEDAINGLPTPSESDTDQNLKSEDIVSHHNRFWNWMGINSWVRDPHAVRETARCCRGYASAQFFYTNTFNHRHEDIGWRPILEAPADVTEHLQLK